MRKSVVFISFLLMILSFWSCSENKQQEDKIGLIPCQLTENGKWGYTDFEGNLVIDTLFTEAPSYFREGYALIMNADRSYDFIDKTGKKMGRKFVSATLFSEGLACVVEKDGAPFFINTKFEKVFELKDAYYVGMFSEGLVRFSNKEGKWGFADMTGKIAVKPQFDNVMNFSEGYAIVLKKESDSVSKYGFINNKGEVVLPYADTIKAIQSFRGGLAAYNNGKGWGFLDYTGKAAIAADPDREEVTPFYGEYASYKEGDVWGLMDKKGEKTGYPKFEMPVRYFNGSSIILENNKFGFMNDKEEVVIKPIFKEVAVPFLSSNAIVKAGNNYIIIDPQGRQVGKAHFRNINPLFITVDEELQTIISNTPEVAAIEKARTDSLNALKQAQTAASDSLQQQQMMMQQQGMLEQQLQQQQMQQQQFIQQYLNLSPRDFAIKMAEATERVIKEGGNRMDVVADGLYRVTVLMNMVAQQKQNDRAYMEEFKKNMIIYYKPVEDKYKDTFVKAQEYINQKMQEIQARQKK